MNMIDLDLIHRKQDITQARPHRFMVRTRIATDLERGRLSAGQKVDPGFIQLFLSV